MSGYHSGSVAGLLALLLVGVESPWDGAGDTIREAKACGRDATMGISCWLIWRRFEAGPVEKGTFSVSYSKC